MQIEIEFSFKRPLVIRILDHLTNSVTYGEFDPRTRKVTIYLDAHANKDVEELIDTIIHEVLHAVICVTEPSVCDLDDEEIIEKLMK